MRLRKPHCLIIFDIDTGVYEVDSGDMPDGPSDDTDEPEAADAPGGVAEASAHAAVPYATAPPTPTFTDAPTRADPGTRPGTEETAKSNRSVASWVLASWKKTVWTSEHCGSQRWPQASELVGTSPN